MNLSLSIKGGHDSPVTLGGHQLTLTKCVAICQASYFDTAIEIFFCYF